MRTLCAGPRPSPPVTRTRLLLCLTGLFALGVATGIGLQRRWPLGRVRDELSVGPRTSPPLTLAALAQLPRHRRLVIVCAGQSNAANYGEPRRSGGAGVYAFADGQLFAAIDPLPGGDGYGGSIWTRLGARLAQLGRYDAITFAIVAQGSTRIDDWTPGGRCHGRLNETLRDLARRGLPVDFILWQQGEEEGRQAASSGQTYAAALTSLQDICRQLAPTATFLAARATFEDGTAANEQIRLAQAAGALARSASPGPDLDDLGADFRRDGIHFNSRGLDAAADRWLASLREPLTRLSGPTR